MTVVLQRNLLMRETTFFANNQLNWIANYVIEYNTLDSFKSQNSESQPCTYSLYLPSLSIAIILHFSDN